MRINFVPEKRIYQTNRTKSNALQHVTFEAKADCFIKQNNFKAIKFEPALDIDSAKKYAKNILNINKCIGFKKSDLQVLNWINESCTYIYNISKGLAQMPNKIVYTSFPEEESHWYGAFELTYPVGEISFNKVFLKNIDNIINDKISCALAHNFINDNKGNFYIDSALDSKSRYSKEPCIIQTDAGYKLGKYFVKTQEGYELEQDLNKFKQNNNSLSFGEKIALNFSLKSILNSKFDLCNNKIPLDEVKFIKGSPYKCIAHEIGHLNHFSIDKIYAERMLDENSGESPLWRKFKNNDKEIAQKVSAYSGLSPYEFVAETFAMRICHPEIKLPLDVIKLYEEHDGPIAW